MSDRVDEERLMLYGPGPVDDNSWIRFSVLLMDQSVALAGVGRAVASIDGGDERPEVARFDIVLDNLQFEGSSEVVYERMLVYRSEAFAEAPATGEVSTEEVDAAEAALVEDEVGLDEVGLEEVEAAEELPSFADGELAEDPTMVASADEYAEHVQATAEDELAVEDGAEAVEMVADEHEPYAEAPPTDVVMDDAVSAVAEEAVAEEEVAADEIEEYAPASTEAEGFADAHTDDLEGPADDWGTGEVDVSDIDEVDVADVADVEVPPSAAPPAPPSQPPGFVLEPADGALTRPSRGATWTPNLALAPDPRHPSGLFPYAGGLPIPELAPRPDLDPSYHIRPAPRPVESGGDSTDLEGVGATSAYEDVGTEVYDEGQPAEAIEEAEVEATPVEEAANDDVPADIEPVETGGLDYEEDYEQAADAASFDDLATEVVEEASDYDEPPAEGFDDAEATRMEIEAPEEQ